MSTTAARMPARRECILPASARDIAALRPRARPAPARHLRRRRARVPRASPRAPARRAAPARTDAAAPGSGYGCGRGAAVAARCSAFFPFSPLAPAAATQRAQTSAQSSAAGPRGESGSTAQHCPGLDITAALQRCRVCPWGSKATFQAPAALVATKIGKILIIESLSLKAF